MSGMSIEVPTKVPQYDNNRLKEPVKLIGQLLFFAIIFFPVIIWTGLTKLFCLPKQKSVEGNIVLITGSANGLGRQLAFNFAKRGAKVVCADVDDAGNEETVRLVKQMYSVAEAKAYHCNVANPSDIAELHKNIKKDFGLTDIIVNNAGLVCFGEDVESLQPANVRSMFAVNVESHFFMAQEFLPEMKMRNRGHIVAIASESALGGLPRACLYSSSKHGVLGFMESLYYELRDIPNNNIKTSCICPYFMRTNELYSSHWNTRLPELKVEHAAPLIVKAIRQNKRLATVPSFHLLGATWLRLLPDYLHDYLRDVYYVILMPFEKKVQNTLNSYSILNNMSKEDEFP